MRWARLVLAVILVVGWTSAAAAEGAWVLWFNIEERGWWDGEKQSPIPRPRPWEPWQGFAIWLACERGKESAWQDKVGMFKAGLGIGLLMRVTKEEPFDSFTATYTQGSGESLEGEVRWRYRLVCLPDTIDPREKK